MSNYTRLQVKGSHIGDEAANLLTKEILLNTSVENISSSLLKNTILTSLDLSRNYINDDGAKVIASFLLTNNSLRSLYLNNNNIGDDGIMALASALSENNSLTNLILYNNNFSYNIGVKALINSLSKNTSLTNIELYFDVSDMFIDDIIKTIIKRNINYNKCKLCRNVFMKTSNIPDELNDLVNSYVLKLC
jgi:Ran GTPase-activating protein (RanGAP) involved in mRNA processing and transport